MTKYKVPKPTLFHLLPTWSAEFARMERAANSYAWVRMSARRAKAMRAENPDRLRERPWRIINQRKRLFAAYWAGWRPDWMRPTLGLILTSRAERYGLTGPKWLGGRP